MLLYYVHNLQNMDMSTTQNNRDCKRQNKANTAVRATIYSEISKDAVERMEQILDHLSVNYEDMETSLINKNLSHMSKIVKIIKECNYTSQKLYVKCSTYVKSTAIDIAHKENAYVKRAIKFKETSDLGKVMFHYHPDMLRMYTTITEHISMPTMFLPQDNVSDSEDESMLLNPESESTQTPITPIAQDTSINNTIPQAITYNPPHVNMNRDNTISYPPLLDNLSYHNNDQTSTRQYPLQPSYLYSNITPMSSTIYIPYFRLPPPIDSSEWFTPLQAVLNIIRYGDNRIRFICDLPHRPIDNKLQRKKVNSNLIIDIMIMKGYIPVNKTTMYVLLKEYRKEGRVKYPKWRDKNKTGPKPMLERSDITRIIDHYKDITEGGCCSSSDDLEATITKAIQNDLASNNGPTFKKTSIPETTMNRYVKGIMSIYEYNIQEKVSNKTESRAAAEFKIIHSSKATNRKI